MKLSVIVPCYNEERSILEFYDETVNVLKKEKIDYELIMIDDGSTDDTLLKLKEINKKDKDVKVISFSRNFGKESAMYAGLKNANGAYVAIMDSDMQHNPLTLVEMYNKLINNPNYDVVCAYRENRNDEPAFKRFLQRMAKRIFR